MERVSISIMLPIFNGARFLKECIVSILKQSYSDFEILAVNDGGTDNSVKILKSFKDERIRIFEHLLNRGYAAASNTALENAKGEYICWISCDDLYLQDKLKHQVCFLKENLRYDFCYTDYNIINEKGNVIDVVHAPWYWNQDNFINWMFRGNFVNGSSVMFKRECIDMVGEFSEDLKFCADGEMWFRMLKFFNFGHIPKVLVSTRWHCSNLSKNLEEKNKEREVLYERAFKLYPEKISLFGDYGTR